MRMLLNTYISRPKYVKINIPQFSSKCYQTFCSIQSVINYLMESGTNITLNAKNAKKKNKKKISCVFQKSISYYNINIRRKCTFLIIVSHKEKIK